MTAANAGVFLSALTIPALDPVALVRALGLEGSAPVVLLDSAGGSHDLAGRHFLAWDPVFRLRARRGTVTVTPGAGLSQAGAAAREMAQRAGALCSQAPFAAVRGAAALAAAAAPLDPGFPERDALYGLFAYDAVRYLEELPDTTADDLGLPDVDLFLPGRLLRYDIASGELLFVDRLSPSRPAARREQARVARAAARAAGTRRVLLAEGDLPVFRANFTRRAYEAAVARTRDYIYAGDIFQANLSQRFDLCYTLPSLHLYDTLRTVNPSPFAGYLNFGEYELISSSPERLVSLSPDGWAQTRPIAGTRPRGTREPEDDALTQELNLDPKDRAEHIMLVDLERNDLGKVSDYGTVRVSELMVNEYYSHVIHIVSNVRGRLHRDRDAIHLLQAMFPGGTITGCPKVRCMEIIDELETVRRGPYTGSFGWLTPKALDLNIVIRTLVRVGDRLYLQAGGGVVADSVPAREYQETLHKAVGMLRAVSASIWERAG